MTSDGKAFAKNEVLAEAAERAKASNGRLHYLGLVSGTICKNAIMLFAFLPW